MEIVGDLAYVATWDGGLVVLNVFNPFNSIKLGQYDNGGNLLDVEVFGDYAYVTDYHNGLLVLDISYPARITKIGQYYDGGNAKGLHIVGNLAYVAEYADGLEIIQIWDESGITDATTVPETGVISRFGLFLLIIGLFLYLMIKIRKI